MKYKAVRGMEDILPQNIGIWQELERIARRELEFYGYTEIRTPLLEDTSVFTRSIGDTTDIVSKEMYTFKDRKGRSLTLRPEGTAPIVRAYVEHSMGAVSPDSKVYYIGPMFRSERPQKGRSRQFHQIGVEVFGAKSPYADAEVIMQMSNMLRLFGIEEFRIKLNSLGCKEDKSRFADRLKKYLEKNKKRLCEDCKIRIKKNVLRALDCKNETCIQAVRNAPNVVESLCDPCKSHFDKLKSVLKRMKIKFEEVENLVRGLDYYTGTVFEVTHPQLGGQDAIGAGGRYDNLVKDFGGPAIGAIGYALGMERVIIARRKSGPAGLSRTVFVATMGDDAKIKGVELAEKIRKDASLSVLTDIKEVSLKAQMRNADRNKAMVVVILGEDELKVGKATIRDMAAQKDVSVSLDEAVDKIKEIMGAKC